MVDFIIYATVGIIVISIVAGLVRNLKKGKSSCGCGCDKCASSCSTKKEVV